MRLRSELSLWRIWSPNLPASRYSEASPTFSGGVGIVRVCTALLQAISESIPIEYPPQRLPERRSGAPKCFRSSYILVQILDEVQVGDQGQDGRSNAIFTLSDRSPSSGGVRHSSLEVRGISGVAFEKKLWVFCGGRTALTGGRSLCQTVI